MTLRRNLSTVFLGVAGICSAWAKDPKSFHVPTGEEAVLRKLLYPSKKKTVVEFIYKPWKQMKDTIAVLAIVSSSDSTNEGRLELSLVKKTTRRPMILARTTIMPLIHTANGKRPGNPGFKECSAGATFKSIELGPYQVTEKDFALGASFVQTTCENLTGVSNQTIALYRLKGKKFREVLREVVGDEVLYEKNETGAFICDGVEKCGKRSRGQLIEKKDLEKKAFALVLKKSRYQGKGWGPFKALDSYTLNKNSGQLEISGDAK